MALRPSLQTDLSRRPECQITLPNIARSQNRDSGKKCAKTTMVAGVGQVPSQRAMGISTLAVDMSCWRIAFLTSWREGLFPKGRCSITFAATPPVSTPTI